MKALVLCVDRDDDIGSKASILGPVIGRDENIAAAMKLGLADPEDTDVNTIMTAIAMHDELSAKGVDVEVATISGDTQVGYKSDKELTRQLEEVLEEVRPSYAYLVSDGAEDEYIYPIIASRVKVDHVRRVYVRQNPGVESLYYTFVRALRDEKIRKKLGTPIGLVLCVFGILSLIPFFYALAITGAGIIQSAPGIAPGLISLVLGLYVLVKAHPVTISFQGSVGRIVDAYRSVKSAIISGDVSVFFNIAMVIFLMVGLFVGLNAGLKAGADNLAQGLLRFLWGFFWWGVVGIWLHELGSVLEAYIKKGRFPASFWPVTSSFLVVGFVFWVIYDTVRLLLGTEDPYTINLILLELFLGLIIVVVGGIIWRLTSERLPAEDLWRR